MKAVVFTLGCKVNECESDALIAALSERGFEVSDSLEPADIYIVNTCAVTREAEKKSRQAAGRIKKLNPNACIIFTGCAAEKNPAAFEKLGHGLVIGVFGKSAIPDMLDECGVKIFPHTTEYEDMHEVKTLRTRAFIKVQDGCDNFCSYCIIPYLRGRSRSRSPQKIISEIRAVNPCEAVLTGINLSSYDFCGTDLKGLVGALHDIKCRIRLGSLEVNVIERDFLEKLSGLYDFAPHFHLSLQSGSDATLKKMNRKYTAEEYIRKVGLIREYFPNAGLTTDIIAGFPTETEEDFLNTLSLVDEVGFSDIHVFTYSPRQGTAAFGMKDLPFLVKKERTERLLVKKGDAKSRFVSENSEKILDFLPEEYKDGYTEGYSGNYLRLYVEGNIPRGNIIKVKVVKHFKDGALAKIND